MPRPKLSAILITRNEATDLPDCLDSLAFCDEIIVVDNGSSDDTVAIARARGAQVLQTADWPGFGLQKQRALDLATGDWVLSIDADERIPPALAEEILRAVDSGKHPGYRLDRRSTYLGRVMRHGGWAPDRTLRLARRELARFTPDIVHERLGVKGRVADLATPMQHLSYRDVEEVLEKQHRYALASAEVRRKRGKRGGLGQALSRSAFAFGKAYIFKLGFLDGAHGFIAAAAKSQETFWRYVAMNDRH